MRRNEFAITDPGEIADFLAEQRWGILAMNDDDGYPYAVPLNYLYTENRVYFHSAPVGRKLKLLGDNPRVQFTVVKEYAYIPSYFPGSEMACSASQFFKSVLLRGQVFPIEAVPDKLAVLEKLMRVFQPEGQYRPITPESESYRKMAAGTGLLAILPDEVSAKFKFGQNLPEDVYQRIRKYLVERNTPLDAETMKMMDRYRPRQQNR